MNSYLQPALHLPMAAKWLNFQHLSRAWDLQRRDGKKLTSDAQRYFDCGHCTHIKSSGRTNQTVTPMSLTKCSDPSDHHATIFQKYLHQFYLEPGTPFLMIRDYQNTHKLVVPYKLTCQIPLSNSWLHKLLWCHPYARTSFQLLVGVHEPGHKGLRWNPKRRGNYDKHQSLLARQKTIQSRLHRLRHNAHL